jgi:hypothetical protein
MFPSFFFFFPSKKRGFSGLESALVARDKRAPPIAASHHRPNRYLPGKSASCERRVDYLAMTPNQPNSSLRGPSPPLCFQLASPTTCWWCAGTDQPDVRDQTTHLPPSRNQSDYVISTPLRAETCCLLLYETALGPSYLAEPWSLPSAYGILSPRGKKKKSHRVTFVTARETLSEKH